MSYIKQKNTKDKVIATVIVEDFAPVYETRDILDENGEKTGEEQVYVGDEVVGKHLEEQETIGNIVIVNTDEYSGLLTDHPSIVEHPELFEIVDDELPEKCTFINYQSETPASDRAGQEVELTFPDGQVYKAKLL